MSTKLIYNRSKCEFQIARIVSCPRCKGSGQVHTLVNHVHDTGDCYYCKGHGRLWKTANSCTLPLYERNVENTQLY